MDKQTFEKGLEIRKTVLGKEYVENALKSADEFSRPFQEFMTEYCWGAVWGREELPKKTRSLLNLAMLGALNKPHELKLHIGGALRNDIQVAPRTHQPAQRGQQGGDPRGVHPARDLRRGSGRGRGVPLRARGVRGTEAWTLNTNTSDPRCPAAPHALPSPCKGEG